LWHTSLKVPAMSSMPRDPRQGGGISGFCGWILAIE
jgi:hypothetical protein